MNVAEHFGATFWLTESPWTTYTDNHTMVRSSELADVSVGAYSASDLIIIIPFPIAVGEGFAEFALRRRRVKATNGFGKISRRCEAFHDLGFDRFDLTRAPVVGRKPRC